MSNNLSQEKTRDIYGKITAGLIVTLLVSACSGHFSTSSIAPLMATITQVWPEKAHIAPQLISLPSLLMVPPVIVMGAIARVISKKYILMTGTLMFFLGGFLPIFSDNFYVFLVGRCFVGLGTGIMVSLPTAITGQIFSGKKQTSMMGGLNGAGALIGMIVSASVGYLAMISFKMSFLIQLLMLVFFIMQWIFLPKMPPENQDATMSKVDENGNKIGMGLPVILSLIGFLIWKSFVIVFIYVISHVVQENAGGTVADSGLVNTVYTGVVFLWSMLFIPIYNKAGNWVLPIGLSLGIVSFMILSVVNSLALCYIWTIFHAGCMTMMYPLMFKKMSVMPPRVWITTAVAFISIGSYGGQALAPYVMNAVIKVVGSGAPFYRTYAAVFAVFTVIGIGIVIYAKKTGKKMAVASA